MEVNKFQPPQASRGLKVWLNRIPLPPVLLWSIAWLFLGIATAPLYFVRLKQGYGFAYADLLFLDSLFIDLFQHGGKWAS